MFGEGQEMFLQGKETHWLMVTVTCTCSVMVSRLIGSDSVLTRVFLFLNKTVDSLKHET